MLLISVILILATSIFILAMLNVKSRISYILTLYLASLSNILLTGHLGHIFNTLDSPIFYLGVEVFLFAIVFIVWLIRKKPELLAGFQQHKVSEIVAFARKNVDVALLILGVLIAFLLLGYLAYQVPPNNNDSTSTHMVRVLYWMQNGNYSHWDTTRTAQLGYPLNPSLAILWTMLLSVTDRWVAFVQYVGGIVAALSIMGIAKIIGAKPKGMIFAGLIFLTLPAVVLQSTTTQTGLFSAALFCMGFYFFNYGIKHKDGMHLVLSSISIGFALGSKQVIFFLLPGWGIAMLVIWLVYKKITFKQLVLWATGVFVTFLLFGSQIFFINYRNFGSPLGAQESVSEATSAFDSVDTAVSQIGMNTTRFLYQFTDPTGLPSPLWRWGTKLRTMTGEFFFNTLSIPIESEQNTTFPHRFSLDTAYLLHEDEAWYGVLGFFILVPTMVYAAISHRKKKEQVTLSAILITIGFFICLTLFRPGWDPYQGRYFLSVMMICSAFISLWFTQEKLRRIVGPVSVVVGLLIMFNAVLYNPSKPFLTNLPNFYYRYGVDPGYEYLSSRQSIFQYDRSAQITYQTRKYLPLCQLINDVVPQDATLGYMINDHYFQEYCFFGETFERKIVPLRMTQMEASIEKIHSNEVEYILYYLYPFQEIEPLENYSLLASDEKAKIYIFVKE